MKVEFNIGSRRCYITREPGDVRFSGIKNAAGESRLLYHVKLELNRQGFDFIKKRMYKDGHMVSEMQQYLRYRKPDARRRIFALRNHRWQIEGLDEILAREGELILTIENIGRDTENEPCTPKS